MGYGGKVVEREEARRLRGFGWTMPAIAAALGVSRSSVSRWTRHIAVPVAPRRVGRRRPNALARRKAAEIAELAEAGRVRIGSLSEREFLVAGAALYAGEGSKTDGKVKFANSNPEMVRFFCAWLRHFYSIDESRLRLTVYLHAGLDLDAALSHWSEVTNIGPAQFGKPYRAVPNTGIRHTKHQYGCAYVSYACSRTHRSIMGLVQGLLSWDAIPG